MLRGFVVYFWVGRHRRNVAIREKVSVFSFSCGCCLVLCFSLCLSALLYRRSSYRLASL